MIRTEGGTVTVLPGDFAAVRSESGLGALIHFGEILNGSGFRDYEHAILYVGGPSDLILEAEPGGAKLVPYHYDGSRTFWSSDNPKLNLTPNRRAMAEEIASHYVGTPYSFADYAALALHRLRIPAPDLKNFIASSRHQICSQLVDQCRLDMGSHLFADGRWPGFVTPADLANLIAGS